MTPEPAAGAPDYRARLAQALETISRLRTELTAREEAEHEPVALVGIGCRFPGGGDGPERTWELLRDGVDTVGPFPADRWDAEPYYDPDPEAVAKAYVLDGGYLADVESFDARLFAIPPGEALGMDPQQRISLEVAWEALEHAGIAPDSLDGSRTGVYLGASTNDYVRLRQQFGAPEAIDAYQIMGESSFIAGRIAHFFGLRGPAQVLDTACSSSLVAVHQAVRSLRAGEIDLALAGGVNIILSPYGFVLVSKAQAVARDGRCKSFDASGDGYGRGEGCGIVVLKRLSDARRDGDDVIAVVRGSAINHDGRASGVTVPSGQAQQEVIRDALRDARLSPGRIGYVEAHGTGTVLGDPIELRALEAVLGPERPGGEPVYVGSVKTNIGHLEAAAGVAGLIKTALALRAGRIPPSLHFRTPNANVDWDALHLRVPTETVAWPGDGDTPRAAGLSSFGASGTNAHLVLEQAPPPPAAGEPGGRPDAAAAGAERAEQLVVLSGRSERAVRELAGRWAAHLTEHPETGCAEVARTAATGRSRLPVRTAVVAADTARLTARLAQLAEGGGTPPRRALPRHRVKPAFLFSGQGAQYPGMGRALYASEPVFAKALDTCAGLFAGHLDRPLLDVLFPPADGSGDDAEGPAVDQTAYTQPALFAVEYALAELWASWGVRPAAVLGHSVGEYVAACVAGVLELPDAARLVAVRAGLMQRVAEPGAMIAVPLAEDAARAAVGDRAERVSVAAVNSARSTVLSGARDDVAAITAELAGRGVTAKPLRVSHAFHSPLLEPVLDELRQAAAEATFRPPRIPLLSNVTGTVAGPDTLADPEYWVRHARQAVRFHDGLLAVRELGANAFVEVGPGRTLLGLGADALPDAELPWLASLRQSAGERTLLLESLGALHSLGLPVDLGALLPADAAPVRLPGYPFQRTRFTFPVAAEGPAAFAGRGAVAAGGEGAAADAAEEPGAARGERLKAAEPARRRAELLEYLRGLLADSLGIDAEEIDPAEDLVPLGMDSLLVMQLTKAIKRQLGAVVFANQFFENTTLASWVEVLDGVVTGTRSAAGGSVIDSPMADIENIDRDVALDESIRPSGPPRTGYTDPEHVLLTGATGFVGAYLLDELLTATRARVHCLVRCADEAAGLARLRANLEQYLPWRAGAEERITVVPGDLAKPLLGLTEERFDALAGQLDAIYHNGAWVNFNQPYEQLRTSNVGGTEEILRLACRGPLTPVNHVSSYGVWGLPKDGRLVIREDDDIFGAGKLINGYVQSKWACERMVAHARERGVPVDVYRPGRVLGDSRTGACLTTHFTTRIIKGCLQLGKAPQLDMKVEMTPVDYVAAGLVRASLAERDFGSTYHLVNSSKLPFEDLVRSLTAYGWDLDVVPLEDWWQALLDSYGEQENELHPLMDLLEEFTAGGGEEAIDYDETRIVAALAGSGIACRPLDEKLLALYFDWMVEDGYLPAPAR